MISLLLVALISGPVCTTIHRPDGSCVMCCENSSVKSCRTFNKCKEEVQSASPVPSSIRTSKTPKNKDRNKK